MKRLFPARLCLALVCIAASAAAAGAEIHLEDGSVVIGEVERLVDGEDLYVDTEYMGDVVIEWDAIERISRTVPLNVELFTGERISGSLRWQDGGVYVGFDQQQEMAPDEIFRIEGFTEGVWDGFEGYADAGMNIIRGNNQVTQISYSTGVSFDANRFETGVDSTLIINEQPDGADTRRFTLSANYNQKLTRRWFVGGRYSFEADDQLQLDGRSLFAVTANHRVLNVRRQRLTLAGGLAVNVEAFENRPVTDSLEGLIGAVYRLRTKWDFDFDSTLYVLPSLSESGRVRVQLDSAMSMDLIGDLEAKLTYYNRFDNQPPNAVSNFDYGVTLGVGYEF